VGGARLARVVQHAVLHDAVEQPRAGPLLCDAARGVCPAPPARVRGLTVRSCVNFRDGLGAAEIASGTRCIVSLALRRAAQRGTGRAVHDGGPGGGSSSTRGAQQQCVVAVVVDLTAAAAVVVVLRGTCAIRPSSRAPPMAAAARTSYRSGWRTAIQRPKARPAPGKKVFLEACTGLRCARLARRRSVSHSCQQLDSGATSVT
jgi:hypothetical protein